MTENYSSLNQHNVCFWKVACDTDGTARVWAAVYVLTACARSWWLMPQQQWCWQLWMRRPLSEMAATINILCCSATVAGLSSQIEARKCIRGAQQRIKHCWVILFLTHPWQRVNNTRWDKNWKMCVLLFSLCQILGPFEEEDEFTMEDFHLLGKITLSSSAENVIAKVKQMGMKPKQYVH